MKKQSNYYAAYKVVAVEQIATLNQTVADAENEMQRVLREIEIQNQNHKIELERLHDKHEIGIKKLKIELQTQQQSEIQKLHDKYNQQIAELLQSFSRSEKKETGKNMKKDAD